MSQKRTKRGKRTPSELSVKLNAYAARTRQSNAQIAALIGCHESAICRCRRLGRDPRMPQYRVAIEALVGGGGK